MLQYPAPVPGNAICGWTGCPHVHKHAEWSVKASIEFCVIAPGLTGEP